MAGLESSDVGPAAKPDRRQIGGQSGENWSQVRVVAADGTAFGQAQAADREERRREALDSLRRDAGWRLYDCPCGARLTLPGELAGERSVACPRCGQVAGA